MQRYRKFVILAWLGCVALPLHLFGLAPHELLVIANRNEPTSVRIARAYMQVRQIPRQNLVMLDLSPDVDGHYISLDRGAFTEQIWTPAQSTVTQRRLDHILAWVFSTHIPFRVDHELSVSVQGLVFLRNVLPAANAITRAEYSSPLFVGPANPNDIVLPPRSLQVAAASLRAEVPIPSMSLGYIGPRGNTEEEILGMIERSVRADASAPSGTVFFVTGEDVRARIREWQYQPVRAQLLRMGVGAVITNAVPTHAGAVLGVMMGARDPNPDQIGTFVPGAVGEHLTSYGATFDQTSQTKITRWISAGVSGTAGTVTEPYAVWPKFPHARFYVHYRSGYSLLESFYLSLRTPLQSFLIGDPLVAPWAPAARLRITGVRENEVVRDARDIDLQITAPMGMHYGRFVYMINGLVVGEGPSFRLDPASIPPGLHELRAVAYRAGLVSSPIFDVVRFQTAP